MPAALPSLSCQGQRPFSRESPFSLKFRFSHATLTFRASPLSGRYYHLATPQTTQDGSLYRPLPTTHCCCCRLWSYVRTRQQSFPSLILLFPCCVFSSFPPSLSFFAIYSTPCSSPLKASSLSRLTCLPRIGLILTPPFSS